MSDDGFTLLQPLTLWKDFRFYEVQLFLIRVIHLLPSILSLLHILNLLIDLLAFLSILWCQLLVILGGSLQLPLKVANILILFRLLWSINDKYLLFIFLLLECTTILLDLIYVDSQVVFIFFESLQHLTQIDDLLFKGSHMGL